MPGKRGRPKGSISRPKRALLSLLQEKYPDYHPIMEMVRIAHETDDVHLEAQMHSQVAQYVTPKLKAVDKTVHHVQTRAEAERVLRDAGIDPAAIRRH